MAAVVFGLLAAALCILPFLWAVTHTFSFGHSGGSVPLSDVATVTGSAAVEVNVALAPSTTNQLVALGYLTANVKGVYIKSDQDVTIKVDSSGSPEETILIKAGVPYTWMTGNPSTLLLSSDVSVGWYLTNATASTANFYARILN